LTKNRVIVEDCYSHIKFSSSLQGHKLEPVFQSEFFVSFLSTKIQYRCPLHVKVYPKCLFHHMKMPICQLDSMCWFSHRHSCTPDDCSQQNCTQAAVNVHYRYPVSPRRLCNEIVCYCMQHTAYSARVALLLHCQWGWLSSFLFPVTLTF